MGRNILCLLLGLLVAFGLTEAAVRLWVVGPQKGPEIFERPLFYYKPAHTFSYKNYAYEAVKKDGDFRIAIIGDSFTYPHLIQFDDAFPQRLERMMNLSRYEASQPKVEVINYGVPGLSTIQEIPHVKQALHGKPDILILEITLNDPWAEDLEGIEKRSHGKLSFHPLVIDKTHNPLFYYFKTLGFAAQRIHSKTTHRDFIRYHHWLFEQDHTWGMFTESIKGMRNLCRRNGVRFGAFIFPFFHYPQDDSYPFLDIHQKISAFLEAIEVPYLDLFDVYRGIPHQRLEVVPGFDAHPNELAHRIAAEQLYLWLEQLGYLPSHAVISEKYKRRGPGPRKIPFDSRLHASFRGKKPTASHGFQLPVSSQSNH